MKTVADLLGHARLETTAIYAKLDRDTLATIALPWRSPRRRWRTKWEAPSSGRTSGRTCSTSAVA